MAPDLESEVKTLCICIPTYRRPDMLERCIESAVASAGASPISVVVADDSVSDVNRDVMQRLCAKYPFVAWHRNARNLGIDLNIQHVVSLGDGDFCWLIGEDDRFLPGAVARMASLVQDSTEAFVFSNYEYADEGHARSLGIAVPVEVDGAIPVGRFVEDCLWAIGFIGSCVVERRRWELTSAAEYEGTYFTHVGRILDLLASQDTVLASGPPAIANRAQGQDTFTWKKDSFGVFLGFERMCATAGVRNPSLRGSISRAATAYRRKIGYFSLKTVLRLRAEDAFDFRQFRKYIAGSDVGAWRKGVLMMIAVLPIALLAPMASIYRRHASGSR